MPGEDIPREQEELDRLKRADLLTELIRERAQEREREQERLETERSEKSSAPWTVRRDGKDVLWAADLSELSRLGVEGKLRRDDLVRHKNLEEWEKAGTDKRIFPYEEFSLPDAADGTNPNPLLDEFQEAFEQALKGIDDDTKQLVEAGRDYQAISEVREHWETIQELWMTLSSVYVQFQQLGFVLEHFGSERLRQFEQELPNICYSFGDYERNSDEVEIRVLDQFGFMGIPVKSHWLVKPVILTEFYLMLDILSLLIEPDFVPLEHSESLDETQDRYIAANVKRAVWRRDRAKCVECGSPEKLEYDHIIPVSKGGSNTERNVQLLCEKCNRTKSANIT